MMMRLAESGQMELERFSIGRTRRGTRRELLNVRLSIDQARQLRAIADLKGCTVSELVRWLLWGEEP